VGVLKARALIVLPLGVLLAGIAVRAMVFAAPIDHPLRALEPMFANHPAALVDRAMRSVGQAAAKGGSMPPWFYVLPHPSAKLSAAEKLALMRGLAATLTASPPRGGGG